MSSIPLSKSNEPNGEVDEYLNKKILFNHSENQHDAMTPIVHKIKTDYDDIGLSPG